MTPKVKRLKANVNMGWLCDDCGDPVGHGDACSCARHDGSPRRKEEGD